jgi:hypothetical protein
MGVATDVNMSEIIVSIANAVSNANAILNTDPQSSMAITRFEVNTSFTAVLSVPTLKRTQPTLRLRPEGPGGVFHIEAVEAQRIPEARFAEFLQPTLAEVMLPSSAQRTESARVQIKAVIEAIPNVTNS